MATVRLRVLYQLSWIFYVHKSQHCYSLKRSTIELMKEKGESSATRTALYRKYRPSALRDVVGQGQVTNVLLRSLEQGKIAHAYLLTGPRGVGKTSIARILAHEINKLPYNSEETHLDIIEIDAASNNGVEDVRDLREKVQLAPIAAAKKVYIIDEVHMLSKPAFNALLKTLEEPPAHVVFILATTDLHKVPATIISRTQHFAFHSISPADLRLQLKKIAKSEDMKISDEAIEAIATRGDGSFRDSISLLDQLSSFADDKDGITLDLVQSTLGLPPRQSVDDLLNAVESRDIAAVIAKIDDLEKNGVQSVILADQLIRALRDRLADQPSSVTLLDSLLDVSNSSQPQLKLLTTLVTAAKPKTTTAAHTATKPRPTIIEAPVIVVEKTVKAPVASNTPLAATRAGESEEPLDIDSKSGDDNKRVARESEHQEHVVADVSPVLNHRDRTREAAMLREDSGTESNDASGRKKATSKKTKTTDFDWIKVLDYTKANMLALSTVLNKCDVEFDGTTLTIYAGLKFNKTKLDQAKYLEQLHEALESAGYTNLTINTLAESKPLEDEQLRKVAAMMGGGKEVSLEEE
jgi:DNA polymerase-3 subunit gamma/tau